MITRSADYVEYCRDTARRLRNLQDLALRGKKLRRLSPAAYGSELCAKSR